jgi:hypothetical protein
MPEQVKRPNPWRKIIIIIIIIIIITITIGKLSHNIFYENPSIESRVVPCGQTDRQAGRPT